MLDYNAGVVVERSLVVVVENMLVAVENRVFAAVVASRRVDVESMGVIAVEDMRQVLQGKVVVVGNGFVVDYESLLPLLLFRN